MRRQTFIIAALIIALFVGLGVYQLWKHPEIAAVDDSAQGRGQ